jgi:hypothetical protein
LRLKAKGARRDGLNDQALNPSELLEDHHFKSSGTRIGLTRLLLCDPFFLWSGQMFGQAFSHGHNSYGGR